MCVGLRSTSATCLIRGAFGLLVVSSICFLLDPVHYLPLDNGWSAGSGKQLQPADLMNRRRHFELHDKVLHKRAAAVAPIMSHPFNKFSSILF